LPKYTSIAPLVTKVAVATIDRGESRLMPHTPCPLVHPLPSLVPKPTRSPAAASTQYGRTIPRLNAPGQNTLRTTPRPNRPATKLDFQSNSPFVGIRTPAKIPLIPAIFLPTTTLRKRLDRS